jgi:YgiT-type zinc finger domain-containing protein
MVNRARHLFVNNSQDGAPVIKWVQRTTILDGSWFSDRNGSEILELEMKCPYCKAPMIEEEMAYVVGLEDGQELRLEDVPTWVCERCDYTAVDEAVIVAVEDMLAHIDTFANSDERESKSLDEDE